MALYKKKPVIIEAEQYRPGLEDGFDYGNLGDEGFMHLPDDDIAGYNVPFIKTLEGKHYITTGDMIITGVKGERCPCKADIFEMTYEEVED
jgi:hypothetical protein